MDLPTPAPEINLVPRRRTRAGVGEALSGEGLTVAPEATAAAHNHYVIGEESLNRRGIGRRLRRYPVAWRGGKLSNAVAAASGHRLPEPII